MIVSLEDQHAAAACSNQPSPLCFDNQRAALQAKVSTVMLYLVTIICIMHHTNKTKPPATCLVIKKGLNACVHGSEP